MAYIKIKNRNNFLIKNVPSLHPDSLKYETWWRAQKKRAIEGLWSADDSTINIDVNKDLGAVDYSGKNWRWMPPHLFFYVNFGSILHVVDGEALTAARKPVRPHLRDLEWETFYNWIEAKGFSGFENDDNVSCDRTLKEYLDGDKDVILHSSNYKPDKTLKAYEPVRTYVRKLHPINLGKPLYMNQASNLFNMGSRGLGKSYGTAGGMLLHEMLFDGAKYYDDEYLSNPPQSSVFLGAGIASKSSDLADKILFQMENLPGIWAANTQEEVPSPFYRVMSGNLNPNNMKNPWRYEYEEKLETGRWIKKGTKSSMRHGIYTTENPEAAAGGRYGTMAIEEVGLLPNVLIVHGSNTATMLEGIIKFGSAVYIGTGGNIQKVVESKLIFHNPRGYQMLAFDDEWEGTGEIGYFIPAYYALNQFKDKNGNTDEEKALAFLVKRRKVLAKNTDVKALQMEMMNYPIKPSEMFLSADGNFFPAEDIKHRLGELEADDKLLAASWKASFMIDKSGKPVYVNSKLPVIRNFPLIRGGSMDGAIEIFEMPKRDVDGNILPNRYIAGIDPVDDDGNDDITLSLQSTFILDTFTDRIVAEYTARTRRVETYYEQVRRMLIFYNAKANYEAQKKGIFGHFKNKNSLHLLAPTPQILRDAKMLNTGKQGNKAYGTTANEAVNRYGRDLILAWLERQAYGKPNDITNLQISRSVGALKELSAWTIDINADRVSALGMTMIYREEVIVSISSSRNKKKNKHKDFFDKLYKK